MKIVTICAVHDWPLGYKNLIQSSSHPAKNDTASGLSAHFITLAHGQKVEILYWKWIGLSGVYEGDKLHILSNGCTWMMDFNIGEMILNVLLYEVVRKYCCVDVSYCFLKLTMDKGPMWMSWAHCCFGLISPLSGGPILFCHKAKIDKRRLTKLWELIVLVLNCFNLPLSPEYNPR